MPGNIRKGRDVSDFGEDDAGCFLDLRAAFCAQNEEPTSFITKFSGTDVSPKLSSTTP